MTDVVVNLKQAAAGRPRCCDCRRVLRPGERPAARCAGCVGRVADEMLRSACTDGRGYLVIAGDALAVIARIARTEDRRRRDGRGAAQH